MLASSDISLDGWRIRNGAPGTIVLDFSLATSIDRLSLYMSLDDAHRLVEQLQTALDVLEQGSEQQVSPSQGFTTSG